MRAARGTWLYPGNDSELRATFAGFVFSWLPFARGTVVAMSNVIRSRAFLSSFFFCGSGVGDFNGCCSSFALKKRKMSSYCWMGCNNEPLMFDFCIDLNEFFRIYFNGCVVISSTFACTAYGYNHLCGTKLFLSRYHLYSRHDWLFACRWNAWIYSLRIPERDIHFLVWANTATSPFVNTVLSTQSISKHSILTLSPSFRADRVTLHVVHPTVVFFFVIALRTFIKSQ